jgi:hypothetical protein
MKIVIRAVLERYELSPAGDGPERTRRRSITLSPARGGLVTLRERLAAEISAAQRRSNAVATAA